MGVKLRHALAVTNPIYHCVLFKWSNVISFPPFGPWKVKLNFPKRSYFHENGKFLEIGKSAIRCIIYPYTSYLMDLHVVHFFVEIYWYLCITSFSCPPTLREIKKKLIFQSHWKIYYFSGTEWFFLSLSNSTR